MKWLVVCVALLLGLSACDGDAGASADPTTFSPTATGLDTPSSAATTTPTTPAAPVEPTLPAAAKAPTKAGAEAFVRYYWELVNYTQHTGDTSTLRSISDPHCAPCNAGWKWVRSIYERGGEIRGGVLSIKQLQLLKSEDGEAWLVSVSLATTRQTVRGAGDLNGSYGTEGRDVAMVLRKDPSWRVTSVNVL